MSSTKREDAKRQGHRADKFASCRSEILGRTTTFMDQAPSAKVDEANNSVVYSLYQVPPSALLLDEECWTSRHPKCRSRVDNIHSISRLITQKTIHSGKLRPSYYYSLAICPNLNTRSTNLPSTRKILSISASDLSHKAQSHYKFHEVAFSTFAISLVMIACQIAAIVQLLPKSW